MQYKSYLATSKMLTPLFSISIICKNEETSFPNLHASLKHYIDAGGEIVLKDTGSTDNTIDVLKKLGYVDSNKSKDKLRYSEVGNQFLIDLSSKLNQINKEFIDPKDEPFTSENTKLTVFDFCAARRYAGKCCSNKWVLSVDCDEVFTALNIAAINAIILSKEYNQCVFTFKYMGSDGNISSVTSRDKLYNRSEADWKWLVHEQVKPLGNYTQKLAHLPENILAIDHYQHPAEHRSNYLLSMCVDVMLDPNDQHVFWLGREFLYKGYNHSAIKLLSKYLLEYPNSWSAERCMAAVYIGDAYIRIAEKEIDETLRKFNEVEALKSYYAGTFYDKTFREPWLRMGYYYASKNEHSLVIPFINTALGIKTINKNYMNDLGYCYGPEPYIKLYISFQAINNKSASYETWKRARVLFPNEQTIADHAILFKSFTDKIASCGSGLNVL